MPGSPSQIESAFHAGEKRLWGLCYRITGVAADADDLVQETFVRALQSSPAAGGAVQERWLVRVATNLAIDCLRRRRRRRYAGPWLPSPVEGEAGVEPAAAPPGAAERLELAEDVSYAFLVAMEALSPRSRAALVLTEVLDHSASEVAEILGTSEGNVRVLVHRARERLAGFDRDRACSAAARERRRSALEKFVTCMMTQDLPAMRELLREDVRSITDGAGRYTALREPLSGRDAVARFHLQTARRRAPLSRMELRTVNGDAALVVVTHPQNLQMAPRLVLRCEIDEAGRICELHTILAPGKLSGVRFTDPPATV